MKQLSETNTAKILKMFTLRGNKIPEQNLVSVRNNLAISTNGNSIAVVYTFVEDGVYEIDRKKNKLIKRNFAEFPIYKNEKFSHTETHPVKLENFSHIREIAQLGFLQKKEDLEFQIISKEDFKKEDIYNNTFVFSKKDNETFFAIPAKELTKAFKTTKKDFVEIGLPKKHGGKELVSVKTDNAQVFIMQVE